MVTVLIKPTFPNVIFTKVIMVMFMFMFIFNKVMMVRGPRVFHIGEW